MSDLEEFLQAAELIAIANDVMFILSRTPKGCGWKVMLSSRTEIIFSDFIKSLDKCTAQDYSWMLEKMRSCFYETKEDKTND